MKLPNPLSIASRVIAFALLASALASAPASADSLYSSSGDAAEGPAVILKVDTDHDRMFRVSERVGVAERASSMTPVEAHNTLYAAGVLPGETRHSGALDQVLAASLVGIESVSHRAPRDAGAYTAVVMGSGIKLIPSVEIEASENTIPSLPAEYGFQITADSLFEIGEPIYRRSNCYRKASWTNFRHDICYWKYRIDEWSDSYDYWLYGNELIATSTKSHRLAADPWIGWAKVAQQLGSSERSNYMTFGSHDTVKAHAPRGTQNGNTCTTTTFSTSISAKNANGGSATVGISHPISFCNRTTEYANFSNTYKRATYVWDGGWTGTANRKKSAQVTTQTIIKLKQRPYNSWQPYWSDTAQTKMRNWNDYGVWFTDKTFG